MASVRIRTAPTPTDTHMPICSVSGPLSSSDLSSVSRVGVSVPSLPVVVGGSVVEVGVGTGGGVVPMAREERVIVPVEPISGDVWVMDDG